ncbi:hypothetical protein Agabi119p4_7066 [Agaricus bisporus var. burnettii]|uniref:Methyltransferase domain-containing protein n=1 Tax=Agaricus bisporus var. burnettii TaxID=192524 RepID=A0A8H7KFR5_AGABI|nr:hypothetical protein Agabi119p4_7066 [Agaricus bisporus var. burnettii]
MTSTVANAPIQHQKSLPEATYLLPTTESERIRFDTQHQSITRAFGDKLVLSPVILTKGDKVFDSGAGSCSWLLDFATTLTLDIELYASDIETRFFPINPPKNVKLWEASSVDLPKDWSNAFQLVHQRLLISAFTSNDWPLAISELFRVTKPGGWVELCEAGAEIDCPSHPNHRALTATRIAYEASDHVIQAAMLLPQWLKDAGFVKIQSVEGKYPIGKWAGSDGEHARHGLIGFLRALKAPILTKGGLGFAESEEEYDAIIDDFERICDITPNTIGRNYTIYAHKPVQIVS